MSDSKIQLLPDSLANQIAAGEVVQRPASVVKELLENAIDAGATRILLRIEDAGKTLILIQDNGCGMEFHDARMCFERHATSKIKTTKDLFQIKTLGFRGEALASIAAVAQVELKTKQNESKIGTIVTIEGGTILKHEPFPTTEGSILSIRNLFFNVPARRNFLKSNTTELKQIIAEFQRIALSYPAVHFSLEIDTQTVTDYFPTTLSGRICQIYPWIKETDLLAVSENTPMLSIIGYVGTPTIARKTRGEQFLFVNGRFVKDYSINHAVTTAYRQTLPAETLPVYVLNLTIDPAKTDINIHPTKSEIKFEDDRLVYGVVNSAVKKAIGQTLSLPDIADFQLQRAITEVQNRDISENEPTIQSMYRSENTHKPESFAHLLDKLYKPIQENNSKSSLFSDSYKNTTFTPLFTPFWLVRQSDELFLLQAEAARERVWYERYLAALKGSQIASQKLLYPQRLLLSPEQHIVLAELIPTLAKIGFEIIPYNENSWLITALPFGLAFNEAESQLLSILDSPDSVSIQYPKEQIALNFCRSHQTSALTIEQITNLWSELCRCQEKYVSPFGEVIQKKISKQDVESWF